MAKVEATYKATVKEVAISANGTSFLTLVGTHINGAYAAFINFGICAELSSYNECDYNSEKIYNALKHSVVGDIWLPKSEEQLKALAKELSEAITPLVVQFDKV